MAGTRTKSRTGVRRTAKAKSSRAAERKMPVRYSGNSGRPHDYRGEKIVDDEKVRT